MKIEPVAKKGCQAHAVRVTFTEKDMGTLSSILSEAARTGLSLLDAAQDRRQADMILRLAGFADGFTAAESGDAVSWLDRLKKNPQSSKPYVESRRLVDEGYEPEPAE